MSDNLFKIIDYINDNFRFGSKLEVEKIEKLYKIYPITEREKKEVHNELDSLKIVLLNTNVETLKKIDQISTLAEKKEKEEVAKLIFNDPSEDEKKGSVIDNKLENFAFLDHFSNESLDSVLESDAFIQEVDKYHDVVDKGKNLEYLIAYHSSEDNFEKHKQALNNLVNANQKLVWKVALRYQRYSTVSFDIYDMYQTGMQGLMKAVEKFDISMGNQFSTYAIWWIRQSITRGIADYSTIIRIPVHMRERVVKLSKIQNDFLKENGRVASKEELAELLKILPDELEVLQGYKDMANLISLDMSIGEDEGSMIADFIPDDIQYSIENYIEDIALKKEIKKLFKEKLTLKEAKILDARFGLTDNKIHTLEEIGQCENVTRERIRQIEARAIRKLQKTRAIERLKDFYYD